MLFAFTQEHLSFSYDSITGYVPGEWESVLAEHAYIARTKRDAQQRLLARAEAEEALSRWRLEVRILRFTPSNTASPFKPIGPRSLAATSSFSLTRGLLGCSATARRVLGTIPKSCQ